MFWFNSAAMLNCIKNQTKRFPIFVANRLAMIERVSDSNNWHYLPSKLNPTDLPSRGVSASSTEQLKAWLRGSGLLRKPVSHFSKFELPNKNYLTNFGLQIDNQYILL